MIKKFVEFIEEELNYTTTSYGDIEFETRWFYYEPEDEIIYGCDLLPEKNYLFAFNPKTCEVYIDGKKHGVGQVYLNHIITLQSISAAHIHALLAGFEHQV